MKIIPIDKQRMEAEVNTDRRKQGCLALLTGDLKWEHRETL